MKTIEVGVGGVKRMDALMGVEEWLGWDGWGGEDNSEFLEN